MSSTDIQAYYTQSASIETCTITLSTGEQHDLKEMVVEISYFEDIYSFCVSGFLMIRDGLGLIELLRLNGTEIITLKFDKYKNTKTPPKYLVAYTIKDRRPVGNLNGEFYKLYFCSEDLLSNQQMSVSKSYKGKDISYMIKDVLTNELQCKTPISYIQPTLGYYNYIPPMIKPFEVVSELCNYARPENKSESGTVGADMFLFENRFGYNFVSLNTLMQQKPVAYYRYEQSNLTAPEDKTQEDDSIIALEYVRSYNTLRELSNGAYSNKFIGINATTGQTHVKEFNYLKYLSQVPPENGSGVQASPTANEKPEGFIRVVPSNSGENTVDYIKSNKGVTPDFYMQETLSMRTSQLALANHTILKIIVPGNSLLTVGSTIDVGIYSIQMSGAKDQRTKDPVYSGKYLITAARHVLQSSGVYQTVLEISKNSKGN